MAQIFEGKVIQQDKEVKTKDGRNFVILTSLLDDEIGSMMWVTEFVSEDKESLVRVGDQGIFIYTTTTKGQYTTDHLNQFIQRGVNMQKLNTGSNTTTIGTGDRDTENTGDSTTLLLEGILHYPFLVKPDGEGNFRTNLELTNESDIKKLKALGVTIKNKDDELRDTGKPLMGTHVSLRSTFAPRVIDAKKNDITAESLGGTLIGNGTVAKVKANVYEWTFKKKSGTGLGIQAVQILKLVQFTPSTLSEFNEEEGFEISSNSNTDGPFIEN